MVPYDDAVPAKAAAAAADFGIQHGVSQNQRQGRQGIRDIKELRAEPARNQPSCDAVYE